MAEEKPGFLRRLFSFGRKPKAESAVEEAESEISPAPAEAQEIAPPTIEAGSRPDISPKPPVRQQPAPEKAEPAPPAPVPSEKVARRPAETAPPRPAIEKPAARQPSAPVAPTPGAAEAIVPSAEPEQALAPPEPRAPEKPAEPQPKPTFAKPKLPPAPVKSEPPPRVGWLARLSKGMSRSSAALAGNIAAVFTRKRLDEASLQELEDVLIQADLGVAAAMRITQALSAQRYGQDVSDEEVRTVMAAEIEKVLAPVAMPLELDLDHKPHVILVVGVNGAGKTTTIGKLTAKLRAAGHSVLLGAGDTFRAAAIEQLKIWGERTNTPVIAREIGADAAGLAFDAHLEAAKSGVDVMIMDTAGRLQNKAELMAELQKIIRVLKKQDASAPHTVLLTLDATTGQNALNQVEVFRNVASVSGLVMTKLDGTARGGILVAIAEQFGLPVYFLGVGEGVDDLEPFEAREFARSIAGLGVKEEATT